MPKYINAEKVHGNCHFCKKEGETCFDKRGSHRYCWEFDVNFATDVVEVKHGKWVECCPLNEFNVMLDENTYFICSECEANSRQKYNFCPFCGADMKEERERSESK